MLFLKYRTNANIELIKFLNCKVKILLKCESLLKIAFTPKNCTTLEEFVFKIFNNRAKLCWSTNVIKIKLKTYEFLDLGNFSKNSMLSIQM